MDAGETVVGLFAKLPGEQEILISAQAKIAEDFSVEINPSTGADGGSCC